MLPVQCKMARVALGWGIRDLAKKANKSQTTIAKLERGDNMRESTVEDIRRAFERAGIEFTNGDAPGVRLTKHKRKAR